MHHRRDLPLVAEDPSTLQLLLCALTRLQHCGLPIRSLLLFLGAPLLPLLLGLLVAPLSWLEAPYLVIWQGVLVWLCIAFFTAWRSASDSACRLPFARECFSRSALTV